MKGVNSFLVAFSMYSRIPVPQPDWDQSSMDYVMCCFPFVGTVLGGLSWLCFQGGRFLEISPILLGAVLTALPLWISGGIHMDGYMDTRDALASCGDKEKKLAVLKDSHTGAFAVMGCGLYLILSFGAWCAMEPGQGLFVVCLGYMASRTLSGLSVLCFPKAKKKDSYVAMFAERARKRRAVMFLSALLVLEGGLFLCLGGWRGGLSAAAAAAVFGWYYHMSRKQFGGITGDLAGYFVQLCELAILLAMAVTG